MPRRNDINLGSIRSTIGVGLLLFVAAGSYSQVDCVDPNLIKVSRIHGQVFDPSGVPIPDATISLSREDKAVSTVKTGTTGDFSFKAPVGVYAVRISATGFDQLNFQVRNGADLSSLFRGSDIRAVLSIARVSCPWATTSNREFQRSLKESRKRYNAKATPQ